MHPDFREKTSFIMDSGTYCYKVYIDVMLVKSLQADDHLNHLRDCFKALNEIAALNRFISRSTDKCLLFYELLRGNKKFVWDEKCEEAFTQLKQYLTTPPVLSKPEEGNILSLYISMSSNAVSNVLTWDNRGEKWPIFYTIKRMTSPEIRYPTLEKMSLAVVMSARKLRPYFQSHSIEVLTNQTLHTMMKNTNQSGHLSKWAIDLSEHDITYKNQTAAKSQVLADFLIDMSPELEQDLILSTNWICTWTDPQRLKDWELEFSSNLQLEN
ncbi:hypothetical protein N665_0218s0109 [Sinapis alba]|nr:hypothetical protein N665_0218s0109 [Sinapis alba]